MVETCAERLPFYYFFSQTNRSQGQYLRVESRQRWCGLRREDKVWHI